MKHLSQETEKGKELRCSLGAINIIIINFEKYSTTPVIKQVPILMQLLVGSERKKERFLHLPDFVFLLDVITKLQA